MEIASNGARRAWNIASNIAWNLAALAWNFGSLPPILLGIWPRSLGILEPSFQYCLESGHARLEFRNLASNIAWNLAMVAWNFLNVPSNVAWDFGKVP